MAPESENLIVRGGLCLACLSAAWAADGDWCDAKLILSGECGNAVAVGAPLRPGWGRVAPKVDRPTMGRFLSTWKDRAANRVARCVVWALRHALDEVGQDPARRQAAVRDVVTTLMEGDPVVRDAVWLLAHQRPRMDLAYLPGDIQKRLYEIATDKSARFLFAQHPDAPPHRSADTLLRACVQRALGGDRGGLFLEFGVYEGRTIRLIAEEVRPYGVVVHGFDSFRGLPEDWNDTGRKGAFDRGGQMPEVPDHVHLHAGWFEESLPAFLQDHPGRVSFVHIDSDLYSSARTVLLGVRDRLGAGSVLLFDELLNYPTFEQHEFRAFTEFLAETGWSCECLGYDTQGFAAGFVLKEAPACA